MGKKQHQKDKLYLTTTEYTYLYGGRRPDADLEDEQLARFRRLPFNHCCLSFQPFQHPYCTPDGYIFDLNNIIPFLSEHKINPIDGKPLDTRSLTKLIFSKNSEGEFQCPVLLKTFNENSHIVAIKTTGNVFSYEAVEQLNIKPKYYKDLLNDKPFARKDIITIQDPMNIEKQNASNYYHVRSKLKFNQAEEYFKKSDSSRNLRNVGSITKSTLAELGKSDFISPTSSILLKRQREDEPKKPCLLSDLYSDGSMSSSVTSTAVVPETKSKRAHLDPEAVMLSKAKGKAYIRLTTNLGPLNLELYCEDVPKTCYNFIMLCKKRYYDKTIFHRSIRNFMIQGGDPTGTGRGGESYWKKPFEDEFKGHLVHSGRGILSMANAGPNTNRSQFFITFRSCKHLDRKHSVFGKVVGGAETLDKMEKVATDDKDKPLERIQLIEATVYVDPFEAARAEVDKELTES